MMIFRRLVRGIVIVGVLFSSVVCADEIARFGEEGFPSRGYLVGYPVVGMGPGYYTYGAQSVAVVVPVVQHVVGYVPAPIYVTYRWWQP